MKKLTKLNINPERILKDDELKSLNGGDCWTFLIKCSGSSDFYGQMCGNNLMETQAQCVNYMNQYGSSCVCYGF